MFGERKVNLQLTDRAREFIEHSKASAKLKSPILSIGRVRFSGDTEDRWTIGFYERSDVREGWRGITPHFDFVVIQEWILDALDSKTLDVIDENGRAKIELKSENLEQ
jgi:hypothetical protein